MIWFRETVLSQAVRAGRITSPIQRQSVTYQLACALGHMHASGVVHRDLKPPNILLSAECTKHEHR